MNARSAWPAIMLGVVAGLAACSSDPAPTPGGASETPAVATPVPVADDPRPGLVVHRWGLPEDGGIIDAVLAAVEPEGDESIAGTAAMQRNGFRILVLDPEELDLLRRTLGAEAYRGRTWHGEAIGWRNLVSRRLGRGSVLLLDGRARRMDDRVLAMAARGYSIPTVDDAALHVELTPYLVESSIDPMATRRLGDLRGVPLCHGIECTLEPGQAVVVASIPRLRAGRPRTSESDETDPASGPPSTTSPPGLGAGPVAPLPPTAAELLLDDAGIRSRGLMIITGRPHPAFGVPDLEAGPSPD